MTNLTLFFHRFISLYQVAIPDVIKAATNADILIFVLPHQFVSDTCQKLKASVKQGALGVSLIKVQYRCCHNEIYVLFSLQRVGVGFRS